MATRFDVRVEDIEVTLAIQCKKVTKDNRECAGENLDLK